MKILIFSQVFWPESFRINDVAKTLSKIGHHVEVVTGKPNYPRGEFFDGYRSLGFQQEDHDGYIIHRVPILARGKGALRLALNYISFVISGLLFSPWLLRGRKFDVIFVYAPSPILQAIPAIFLGWIRGTPVILWVQDLWPESLSATGYIKNKLILKFVEYIVQFIYRHVDLLLVPSNAFIDPVTKLASDTTVKYYPNSVDKIFSSPVSVSIPNLDDVINDFSVMFAGNLGSAQAVGVMIEAATLLQEYTDINFVILGDGSCYDWMLQEVSRCGLSNFYLPGRFPVESMPGFMQKATVLLVTLADHEIFAATVPYKIQSYMAAGRPIIVSLNGEGARLVIEAKAGLAAPAEDARALADAVLEMYRMPLVKREKLGNNAQSYYKEHFDHDKLLVELVNHFEVTLNNSKELS